MSKLKDIAAVAMDMFHQNYAKDDEFFDLEHFQFLCAGAYNRLFEADFENAKAENKSILGFSFVALPADWILEKKVAVKKGAEGSCIDYVADLCDIRPVGFSFDALDSGIQNVMAVGSCNRQFVKIASKDVWRVRLTPVSGYAFYYRIGQQIRFHNVNCNLEEITLQYIPEINSGDGEAEIPSDKDLPIINVALQMQIAARDGKMQDFSIDSNANMIPQTEINKQQA